MTRFLLATDSVHTTAAGCDYLAGRLDGGDEVTVLAVVEPDSDTRDGGDALNVARARLAGVASVETETGQGDPAEAILAFADEVAADEILLGPRRGAPGADAELGETARAVLASAAVPVVVFPIARLE